MKKKAKTMIAASQLMVEPGDTVSIGETIMGAVWKMYRHKICIIPVVGEDSVLVGIMTWYQVMDRLVRSLNLDDNVSEVLQKDGFLIFQVEEIVDLDFSYDNYQIICVCEGNIFKGVIYIDSILKFCKWKNTILSRFEELYKEYEMILNNCCDSMFVTDGTGRILWYNNPTVSVYDETKSFAGRNVEELEREGVFFPSVARLVLRDKKSKTLVQRSSSGRDMIVTGVPVFNERGEVYRVITVNRDFDSLLNEARGQQSGAEIEQLYERLNATNRVSEKVFSELKQLRKESLHSKKLAAFISKEMKSIMQRVEKISKVNTTVLLMGESGVGKGVFARAIHNQSLRKDEPFIKINCGAIPENLLESELFGYEAGAFTGAANKRKLGLFEVANRGTIFLDEVAELPLNLQVKLLHVLQERSFIRVGGAEVVYVDVRVVAATNKNLSEMVKNGLFREDLYYRLNVVPIVIPPLRKRKEDVPQLILYFLDNFNKKYQRSRQLSMEVMKVLLEYDWPGNIRELENLMERLVVIGDGDIIYPYELPQNIYCSKEKKLNDIYMKGNTQMTLSEAVQMFEHDLINDTYSKYKSTAKVAEVLGVNRSTITRKLQKENGKRTT